MVALYLLANVAYVVTLPLEGRSSTHPGPGRNGRDEARARAGRDRVMAGAILVSTFGCVNGLILAGARVYYAMAPRRTLLRRGRHHQPAPRAGRRPGRAGDMGRPSDTAGHGVDRQAHRGPKFGNLYSELLEFIIPADLSFYALMVGAVILLRRKAPGLKRPYRTPGYPVPALIFISLAVLLVLDFVYLARDLGFRLPDRADGHSGVFYLVPQVGAGSDGRGVELNSRHRPGDQHINLVPTAGRRTLDLGTADKAPVLLD